MKASCVSVEVLMTFRAAAEMFGLSPNIRLCLLHKDISGAEAKRSPAPLLTVGGHLKMVTVVNSLC